MASAQNAQTPGRLNGAARLPDLSYMDLTSITSGYHALHHQAAWLDLAGRGKIRLTGEDRARLLHAMTTNQVQNLQPGQGCYAFFLNAQGRILADVTVLCLEDSFLLLTEPETRKKVLEHLDRYIIADDVTLEDETETLDAIAVEGPQAEGALAQLGALAVPAEPYGHARSNGWIVVRADTTGSGGFLLILPAAEKPRLLARLEAASVPLATPEEARTVRIENGRPRYGEEITERYLVQETGQLHAVNFSKGCYLGQEIVERIRSRAQIHRILRRVEIDTPQPPQPGAKLRTGDADAGEISSAAFSPSLGKTVALAYVKIASAEPGTNLTLGDAAARVAG